MLACYVLQILLALYFTKSVSEGIADKNLGTGTDICPRLPYVMCMLFQRCGLEGPGIGFSRDEHFLFSKNVQTGSGAQTAPYQRHFGVPYRDVIRQRPDV